MSQNELKSIRETAERLGHPRLFVGAADRQRILEKANSGICRQMGERLRMKCEAYIQKGGEHFVDFGSFERSRLQGQLSLADLYYQAGELAFGGWLWGEARFSEPAKSIVMGCIREKVEKDGRRISLINAFHRHPHAMGFLGCGLAWAADFLRPHFGQAEWQEIVGHVRDYLFDYGRSKEFEGWRLRSPGHNYMLTGTCGIGQVTLLVAEDISDDELDWGVSGSLRNVLGYCRESMDDDGGCREGPGYGVHSLRRVIAFGESLRRHGLPFLSQYEPLHRYGRWLTSILAPGGSTVALGDSFPLNITPEILLLAEWFQDPVLQWTYLRGLGRADHRVGPFGDSFAAHGVESELSLQLAWYNPDFAPKQPDAMGWSRNYFALGSDFVTLRTGWAETDVVAVVSGCGRRPACTGHLGNEAGALSLWAFGQELLYDPGYGFSTADAHSTVAVSGVKEVWLRDNAMFGARAIRFAEGAFAALCAIDMSQMRDCCWAVRDVALIYGETPYFIVADDLNYRSDWSEYDWFWQAHPSAQASIPTAGGPARIVKDGAALDILSFTPAPDAYPRPYEMTWLAERAQPWSWTGYAKTELNRLRMRLAGYNGRLLSVVVPRRLETPSPVVKSIECLTPGIALRVEWPWASDTVIFQPLSRFLQTESCTGSGRLAVVREKDGVPTRHLLVDGYELNFKGQVLVPPQMRAGEFISA